MGRRDEGKLALRFRTADVVICWTCRSIRSRRLTSGSSSFRKPRAVRSSVLASGAQEEASGGAVSLRRFLGRRIDGRFARSARDFADQARSQIAGLSGVDSLVQCPGRRLGHAESVRDCGAQLLGVIAVHHHEDRSTLPSEQFEQAGIFTAGSDDRQPLVDAHGPKLGSFVVEGVGRLGRRPVRIPVLGVERAASRPDAESPHARLWSPRDPRRAPPRR